MGLCSLASLGIGIAAAQSTLPDAPAPQPDLLAETASSSPTLPSSALVSASSANSTPLPSGQQTFPPEAPRDRNRRIPGLSPRFLPLPRPCETQACTKTTPLLSCCVQDFSVFDSYLQDNALHVYTRGELGRLAIHGVTDPFNLLTIGGTSAISIGQDSHTPYGPGLKGWAKLSGVTLTEDMTGEFVGTFLIPSLDHQDPHYHREPNAHLARRIVHCVVQPFWIDSDTGGNMVNYATLVGSIVNEAVDITYVPYQRSGWGPSAERIALGWTNAPVGNFITEFVPDLANHLNFRVVFIQRIIDRVAVEEGGAP